MTTDEERIFHAQTSFEDIQIVKKNFDLPLDRAKKVTNIHSSIKIAERLIHIGGSTDSFYVIKDVSIAILGNVDDFEIKVADISFVFTLKFNNEKLKFIDANSKRVESSLSEWLDNVVLATARGIMYSEFRGTYVGNIILPIIKPGDLS
jgi:hypothetical protein